MVRTIRILVAALFSAAIVLSACEAHYSRAFMELLADKPSWPCCRCAIGEEPEETSPVLANSIVMQPRSADIDEAKKPGAYELAGTIQISVER